MHGVAPPPIGETDLNWPRFLSRDTEIQAGVKPPPLPAARWSVDWVFGLVGQIQMSKSKAAVLSVSLATFVIGTAALAWWQGRVPQPQPAERPRNEVTEALQIVAQLETRLSYASTLKARLQEAANNPAEASMSDTTSAAGAEASRSSISSSPDDVALLILRQLPEGVGFLEGAAAGDGAWSMPMSDPNQLVSALGQGFETPIMAEVEMVSRAGLSLGTLRLPLRKAADAATAAADPRAEAPSSSTSEGTSVEGSWQKSTQSASARRLAKSARPSGPHRKRRQLDDALKLARPDNIDAQAKPAQAAAAAPVAADDKPGPLGKFFAWLKGGKKKSTGEPVDEAPPGGYGLAPQQ